MLGLSQNVFVEEPEINGKHKLLKIVNRIATTLVLFGLLSTESFAQSSSFRCEAGDCVDGVGRLVDDEQPRYWVSEFKGGRFFGRNAFFSGAYSQNVCYSNFGRKGRDGLRICNNGSYWDYSYFKDGVATGRLSVQVTIDGQIISFSDKQDLPAALLDWDGLINDVDEQMALAMADDFGDSLPSNFDLNASRAVTRAKFESKRSASRSGGKAVDYERQAFIAVTKQEGEERLARQGSLQSEKFKSVKSEAPSEAERAAGVRRAEQRRKATTVDTKDAADWMREECDLLGHAKGSSAFEKCLAEIMEFEQ